VLLDAPIEDVVGVVDGQDVGGAVGGDANFRQPVAVVVGVVPGLQARTFGLLDLVAFVVVAIGPHPVGGETVVAAGGVAGHGAVAVEVVGSVSNLVWRRRGGSAAMAGERSGSGPGSPTASSPMSSGSESPRPCPRPRRGPKAGGRRPTT